METSPASRTTVAVLFGGRSGEHGISCVTASGVLAAIDRSLYDVVAVGIDRGGRWWLVDDDSRRWRQVGEALPEVDEAAARVVDGRPVRLVAETSTDSWALLAVSSPARAEAPAGTVLRRIPVDVVLPLLHGPYGEDGTIQGLLDLAGVRYVGSGVLASAAGMDKHIMKTLLRSAGLSVADWVTFDVSDWRSANRHDLEARVEKLGLPVFVKPARAGSSLGVSRVDDPDGMDAAVGAAAAHDPRIVVETAVRGREVECGVLWDGPGTKPVTSVCGEIVLLRGRSFYDFDAKYVDGDAVRLDTPADLPESVANRVRELAVAAFGALQCEGLARVDVFVDGEEVVVNEVNTMPGFTPISMYPRMWAASGVDYPTLVDRLLRAALARPSGLR
jgi:D-alanine-D-alanine ligase